MINKELHKLYLLEKMTVDELAAHYKTDTETVKKALGSLYKKPPSSLEVNMLDVLREIYPKYKIHEQYPVGNQFIDFYIENIRVGIECNGQQHYDSSSKLFFGKQKQLREHNFQHGVANDARKVKVSAEQYIYIIPVKYDVKINAQTIKDILDANREQILNNLNAYTAKSRVFQ